jgi:FkbM family methyltransferase
MIVNRGLGLHMGGRCVEPSGVIHVGGHHGEEAPYYQEHGVGTVVWIEADPDAYEVLRRNTASYPGHRCVQALATDRDGEERRFYRHRFPGGTKRGFCSTMPWNETVVDGHPVLSRLETFDVRAMRTVSVATALRDIGLSPARFQYLSINVQGAELLVLRGLHDYLRPIQWIFCDGELDAHSSRYRGAPTIGDVTEWLCACGFRPAWPPVPQQFFYRPSQAVCLH